MPWCGRAIRADSRPCWPIRFGIRLRGGFKDGVYDLYLHRPVVCFNLFHLIREMDRIPPTAVAVRLHVTDDVSIIDHTSCETLLHYLEQFNSQDGKVSLEIRGFERMRPLSDDRASLRVADRERSLSCPQPS